MSHGTQQPVEGFASFGFDERLERGLEAIGFTAPRPIQQEAIPAAMKGRDILGLAATGTGKTAAFALPILERLLATRGQGPRALIVAPTRELALQISEETRQLARFTNIRIATVFGGVGMAPQIAKLKSRPEIVVACPGRLLDLHRQRIADLSRVETLVLDEADHMFDMGFLPDVRRILAALPAQRQNLLFSATMPPEIRGLADNILNKPVVVELHHSAPAATIEHALYPIDEKQKLPLLERVFREDDFVSSIVFTRTKHRAKRLATKLTKSGYRAVALQGNMSQGQRERAMQGFRKHTFDILVATDIAARGIDVAQVSHVVNFDMPNTPDAYTHRIGRTGRAEREGKAYTFVTTDDHLMVRQVERRIGEPIPRRAMNGIASIPFPSASSSGGDSRRSSSSNDSRRSSGGATRRPDSKRRPAKRRPRSDSANRDNPRPGRSDERSGQGSSGRRGPNDRVSNESSRRGPNDRSSNEHSRRNSANDSHRAPRDSSRQAAQGAPRDTRPPRGENRNTGSGADAPRSDSGGVSRSRRRRSRRSRNRNPS